MTYQKHIYTFVCLYLCTVCVVSADEGRCQTSVKAFHDCILQGKSVSQVFESIGDEQFGIYVAFGEIDTKNKNKFMNLTISFYGLHHTRVYSNS